MAKKTKHKQTAYEEAHDRSPRTKLRENLIELFDQLHDEDFHNMYSLLWSLTAKDLLIKSMEKKGYK